MMFWFASLPWRAALAAGAALVLGACASSGATAPGGSGVFTAPAPNAPGSAAPGANGASPSGTPGAPAPTPLAQEQRFLEEWFRGTPVVIAAQPPTTLQLDVPLVNSFDAGKADVKPALNAVLARVSQSLLRHNGARLYITAPGDASNAALAQARTERVRDALVLKGIAATRVSLIESSRAGSPVQLRLAMPAVSSQPVARRGEAGSTASRGGVQPISTQRPIVPAWTERKQP